jgi:hypothetical protein
MHFGAEADVAALSLLLLGMVSAAALLFWFIRGLRIFYGLSNRH